MAWCPKCKTEYREGITVCADCGSELVDELVEEEEKGTVAYIENEELAEKLITYLASGSIDAVYEFDESQCSYRVDVPVSKLAQAKVEFRAFYTVESQNERHAALLLDSVPEDELSEEDKESIRKSIIQDQVYQPSEVYVKKAEESKVMVSTAATFLGFAALIAILAVLNILKIMTVFSSPIYIGVFIALAVGCAVVGINAIHRAKNADIASKDEEKLTAEINKWLDENITEDLFADVDPDLGEEIAYLQKTELIKAKLNQALPGLADNYADALVEEFYDRFTASIEEQ